jgi:hypothetical protein
VVKVVLLSQALPRLPLNVPECPAMSLYF